jgi:hypothetical protein
MLSSIRAKAPSACTGLAPSCSFLPNRFATSPAASCPIALPCRFGLIFASPRAWTDRAPAFTHGLAALGHKEFETAKSPESAKELRDRLLGLVGYVLEHGQVIKDGDTIGVEANERIKVTYGPSAFGVPGEVMRPDYTKPKRSRGGLTAYGYLHLLATAVRRPHSDEALSARRAACRRELEDGFVGRARGGARPGFEEIRHRSNASEFRGPR